MAGARFGADNILSAVAHHDEAAPHVHVLLLVGHKMAGSELVGNRRTLADMQAAFHAAVGAHHGLRKAPKRLAGPSKEAAAHLVLQHLRKANDGALRSTVWAPAPAPAPVQRPAFSSLQAQSEPEPMDETTRIRDIDLDPARYDPNSGDYIPRKPPAPRQRDATDTWVAHQLHGKSSRNTRQDATP